jgi:hypothetical protein
MKRKPTEWEKNLCQLFIGQRFIFRFFKELKKFNIETNNPVKKWANYLGSSQKQRYK